MTVELITHNTGEVLDLTTGGNTDVTKEQPELLDTTTTTVDGATTDDVISDAVPDGDVPSVEGDGEVTDEVDVAEPEYFFGDNQVNVEVPDEIGSALTEAGIDTAELLGQLFKKDGNFELEPEMRTKLEDKFGKHMVDGYLHMYKGVNASNMAAQAAAKQSDAEAETQRGNEYAEAVGGVEGLEAMETYITDSFTPQQLDAYNAVMETSDHSSQMLIISQVKMQMQLADKLANGDKSIDLIGDKDSTSTKPSTPMSKGWLSIEEYDKIMLSDKYWEDKSYMAQVDNARIMGKRKEQS